MAPTNLVERSTLTKQGDTVREQVLGKIFDVSPNETPIFSDISKNKTRGMQVTKSAQNTFVEWVEDLKPLGKSNAQDEGADFAGDAVPEPIRYGNFTQISHRGYSVTGTTKALNMVGRKRAWARQMVYAMRGLKMDLEFDIISRRIASKDGSSGTGTKRYSGGIPAFIRANTFTCGALKGTAATKAKVVWQRGDNKSGVAGQAVAVAGALDADALSQNRMQPTLSELTGSGATGRFDHGFPKYVTAGSDGSVLHTLDSGPLAMDKVNEAIRAMYVASDDSMRYLYADTVIKEGISKLLFKNDSGTRIAAVQSQDQGSGKSVKGGRDGGITALASVRIYRSNFSDIYLIPTRTMGKDESLNTDANLSTGHKAADRTRVLILDTSHWAILWLRKIHEETMGKAGDYDRGIVRCEYTLLCKSAKGSAVIEDIQLAGTVT